MKQDYVIGVDLGGTKILTALFDAGGNIVHKEKVSTNNRAGTGAVINRIIDTIHETVYAAKISTAQIAGIGVAAPGPLDVSAGIIEYIASMNWTNVAIKDILQQEFYFPVFLENDCNAAAFAESVMGAGRGYKDIIYVTVSTGIGSGIIIGGEIYHGRHDSAGEFGHICVQSEGRLCSCGNRGCLQAYASGTALSDIAMETLPAFLSAKPRGTKKPDAAQLAEAARNGDSFALKIFAEAGEKLGIGISVLLQLFDPEIIIVGGGVSESWDLLYGTANGAIKEHAYKSLYEDMRIAPAELGNEAGVIGAALIARHKLGK